jgi:hypothetical protein
MPPSLSTKPAGFAAYAKPENWNPADSFAISAPNSGSGKPTGTESNLHKQAKTPIDYQQLAGRF